jgi:hypothetical protein
MASTAVELLRRRFGEKSLPYDAEIEYLICNKTQYVNTNIVGNENTKIEFTFLSTNIGSVHGVAGRRKTNTNSISIVCSRNGRQRFGAQSSTDFVPSANTIYKYYLDKNGWKVNDVSKATWSQDASFSTDDGLLLGWAGESGVTGLEGNLISARIWSGNTLVGDYIPVRVGQVGYMYDRVSGQLFGNVGSGDFILGNDINT